MGIKRIASAIGISAAVAIAPVAVAAPAQAAYNCTTWYSSQGWAHGQCVTGEPDGNYYRVNVLCANIFNAQSYKVYGTVVNITDQQPSTAGGCDSGDHYYGNPWIQTMWNWP